MRMIESWFILQTVRHGRCSIDLIQTLQVMQKNICFGLATDDIDPFSTNSTPYSCWSVFVVPYSLPSSLCNKYEFMFLCLIVPGPKAPGTQLNVMLKQLIEELKQLWIGVEAYNCYKKQKFNLRATYLWSVHDFKAYCIFSG
jgi:hypothetical protein